MGQQFIADDQWLRLEPLMPGGEKGRRGPRSDGRRFLEAIFWIAREDTRWSDLPEHLFGPYRTVQRRYYRWIEAGVFDRIAQAMADDEILSDLAEMVSAFQDGARTAPRERRRGDRKPRFSVGKAAICRVD